MEVLMPQHDINNIVASIPQKKRKLRFADEETENFVEVGSDERRVSQKVSADENESNNQVEVKTEEPEEVSRSRTGSTTSTTEPAQSGASNHTTLNLMKMMNEAINGRANRDNNRDSKLIANTDFAFANNAEANDKAAAAALGTDDMDMETLPPLPLLEKDLGPSQLCSNHSACGLVAYEDGQNTECSSHECNESDGNLTPLRTEGFETRDSEVDDCGTGVKREKSVKVKKIFLRMLRKVLDIPSISPLLRVWRGERTAKTTRKQISAGWYGIEVMDVEDVDQVLGKLLPGMDTTKFSLLGPWEILAGILNVPVSVAEAYASLKKGRYRLKAEELPPEAENRVHQLRVAAHQLHEQEMQLEKDRMMHTMQTKPELFAQMDMPGVTSHPISPSPLTPPPAGGLPPATPPDSSAPATRKTASKPPRSPKDIAATPEGPAAFIEPLFAAPPAPSRPPPHPSTVVRRPPPKMMATIFEECRKTGAPLRMPASYETPLVGVPTERKPVVSSGARSGSEPLLACMGCAGTLPCSCAHPQAAPADAMEAERKRIVATLGATFQHIWMTTKDLEYDVLVQITKQMTKVMECVVPMVEAQAERVNAGPVSAGMVAAAAVSACSHSHAADAGDVTDAENMAE